MKHDRKTNRQRLRIDMVIPARNEEDCLPALFAALPRSNLSRIVVADNGSTDRTAQIASEYGAIVVHESRRGYGAACLAALSWIARQPIPPDIVVFLDADLADDPGGLSALINHMKETGADLVIGSRLRRAEKGALTPPQRFGSFLACGIIHRLTGIRFTDLGPMRAMRWPGLLDLHMSDTTWGWTVEMQFKAALRGFRCGEIDVTYRRRHAGQSKISGSVIGSARAGAKILMTLGSIWWTWRIRGRGA